MLRFNINQFEYVLYSIHQIHDIVLLIDLLCPEINFEETRSDLE